MAKNHKTDRNDEPRDRYMALDSFPKSDTAIQFIDGLAKGLEFHEEHASRRTYKRRGEKLQAFQSAVGAIVADLLFAAGDPDGTGCAYRSVSPKSYTGGPVSERTFRSITEAMEELGMLEFQCCRR